MAVGIAATAAGLPRKQAEADVTLEGVSFNGYHLLRLLGRGGAGEVYLAEPPADAPVAERVAVKVYRDASGEPVALDLMRQAQIVAALQHPHILPCYTDALAGGDLGIVMAYARGGSLGDTLNGNHPRVALPLRAAVVARIITQVARTLGDVHARGLEHGDLKPTNLFVRTAPNGNPIVVISDFGHTFLTRAAVATLRQDGSGQPPAWVAEQLAWAAPEQLRGNPTPASDQYSLAALAYFLLTSVRPVSAEAQAVLSESAPRPIAPPSRLNPLLGDEVDAVLFHALSPLPEQRFGDVVGFAHALDDALAASDTAFGSRASVTRQVASLRMGGASNTTGNVAKRTLAQMSYPDSSSLPAASFSRPSSRPSGSGATLAWDTASDLPQKKARVSLRRRFAIFMAVALLLALFSCALSTLAFNTGSGKLQVRLDLPKFTGPNSVPTAQSNPSPQTTAQLQAESRLRAALASQPAYSDALTGTPAAWPVSGKSVFFGTDQRLHLHNSSQTPLFANMPARARIPPSAYAAKVDVSLVNGYAGDHAGMRFLVSTSAKGDTYYSYLITTDARFELWLQQPETGLVFLTSGYVTSLKAGMGRVNTLAVLLDPKSGTLTLFANGSFVYEAPISDGIATTGRLGVLTPDSGVEAAFANFAVYNA